MNRIRIRSVLLKFLVVPIGLVAFLIAAGGALPTAVVHANSIPACTAATFPCAIGNLEFVSFTPFASGGGGGCGQGATAAILNNSLGVGFALSNFGGNPTCILSTAIAGTFTNNATITVQAINGFLINGINGSINCGVSGALTGGLTLDPGLGPGTALTMPCPPLPAGSTMLTTGSVTFTPTGQLTETITLFGTATGPGALSLVLISDQFSLVAGPSAVPEAGTLVLLGTGLLGLAGAAGRRRLRP